MTSEQAHQIVKAERDKRRMLADLRTALQLLSEIGDDIHGVFSGDQEEWVRDRVATWT